MIAPSTLSLAALALRKRIAAETDLDAANILFGHPAHVRPAEDAQAVSAYFFRIHESGNSGAIDPKMPLDTIAHCLITPLGSGTGASNVGEDDISAGENDLAVLGQIMRCMHEHPVFRVEDKNGETICDVEVAPLELTVDELNKIVPTAPVNGGFRPSVAYALALLPLHPATPYESDTQVQIVTVGVKVDNADPDAPFPQGTFGGLAAEMGKVPPPGDTRRPHMRLVREDADPTYFDRVVAQPPKTTAKLSVGVPKASAAAGDVIKVSQRRWDPVGLDYVLVLERNTTTGAEVGDFKEYAFDWELDTRSPGQHLFSVKRQAGGVSHDGNICMVVVAPRSAAP